MKKTNIILFLTLITHLSTMAQGDFKYPMAKKTTQTDDYHGTIVTDPYRWLEDDRSAETGDWVKAQNEVTFDFLKKIPYREKLRNRCEEVFNYAKYSSPFRRGDFYYFYKNDGLQNQSVLYRQKGLTGEPEVVLDPNQLSNDATTRMTQFVVSKNGKYAAYATSKGGSDWQEIHVMDLTTKQNIADKVEWVKVSGISWQGNGFYYSRYPEPKGSELSAKNENHQVFFHKLKTAQSDDKLIFEDAANPQRFHQVAVSDDEKYVFLYVSDRGKGKTGNALFFMEKGKTTFLPIVAEVADFDYSVVENNGSKFIIQTNENAPNSKIMEYNPNKKTWKMLISEKKEPLQGVGTAGKKMFVSYLKDVATKVYVYDYAGKVELEIKLPGLGTASGFGGELSDKSVFYTFTSYSTPSTIYQYEIATKKSTLFRKLDLPFDPTKFETKQVFYKSKDGTRVPMFIINKKGLKLDGTNPTILYGYGGFNISMLPAFNSLLIPYLEQGGVYAVACLRGGAEYGEKWHEQGMKLKKQNVFDDCIAAAEYLIREKITSADRLAVRGGSNGGLLVAAVINQRPDLFRVAIPQVGVMDMLRFQKFTIGWNWIADYGSAENAEEFKALYAYSPIHNLKEGVNYPATMVTTADHDDRVVPAHSFKYAATLQEKYTGKNPMLIRIDTNSGHGASNTKKNIELTADIYSFVLYNMGVVLP